MDARTPKQAHGPDHAAMMRYARGIQAEEAALLADPNYKANLARILAETDPNRPGPTSPR